MLTKEQISDFERDGFLLVKGLYNESEMADITAWTEAVTRYPEVPGQYMMYFEQSKLDVSVRILSHLEDFEPWHEGYSRLFSDDSTIGINAPAIRPIVNGMRIKNMHLEFS